MQRNSASRKIQNIYSTTFIYMHWRHLLMCKVVRLQCLIFSLEASNIVKNCIKIPEFLVLKPRNHILHWQFLALIGAIYICYLEFSCSIDFLICRNFNFYPIIYTYTYSTVLHFVFISQAPLCLYVHRIKNDKSKNRSLQHHKRHDANHSSVGRCTMKTTTK